MFALSSTEIRGRTDSDRDLSSTTSDGFKGLKNKPYGPPL